MSKLSNKEQFNYINKMNNEQKIIFLKILVALASADNKFKNSERDFIKDMVIIFGLPKESVSEILTPLSDDELIMQASKINDRQVALQLIKEACLLANSDGDFSDREILLIGKIGQSMNIELEKIEQISQWIIDRLVWLEQGKLIFEQL